MAENITIRCPLSLILFLLPIEPLACAIDQDPTVKAPAAEMAKLKLFADDMVLYLAAEKPNVLNAFEKIGEFSKMGGYKINHAKSEALLFKCSLVVLLFTIQSHYSHTLPIRFLGIFITSTLGDLYTLNFKSTLDQIHMILRQWQNLSMAIMGRVTLMKMCFLPLLLFSFANMLIKISQSFLS